ncbi:hypothetical protein ACVWXN_006033 [Bradyrhizobium sp. i1.4.4]|uniref:ABC-three component system middle component 2 n=1 Tax=unclassified Bradyrhizobium TaxID=2631580 RepID=UPI0033937D04
MSRQTNPFNSPLEAGIRLAFLLVEAYPRALSLDHLVMLDHILVHTTDFDGPESVHPASPYRIAEPYVRRELIQRALVLFRSRELVVELPTNQGFVWQAGDAAAPFVETLTTRYHRLLRVRAHWTVSKYGDTPELTLAATMGERVVSAIGIEVSQ